VYQLSLPTLIEQEFYPHTPKASKQGWVLGKLHDEWNDLLNEFQCLNIIAPRDHLKTFFFSEAFPLRFAKENPKSRIQIYRKTNALGVETLDKIKNWAKLPYFQDLLGGADLNNKTQLRFGNGTEIFVGGFDTAGRGGHPDLIILDDVIDTDVVYSDDLNLKSKERLASEIMPMAEPHTRIVIIGTVQREDDLYSINWAELENDDGSPVEQHWFSKTYDAILDEEKKLTLFPEKWTWDALMKRRREIVAVSGLQWFLKEYRNIAVKKGGAIIKPDWIKYYKPEDLPKNLNVYTGWDLSTGKKMDEGDWTAKATIGVTDTGDIYVLRGMYRARIDFGLRVRGLIDHGIQDRPIKIRVENNTFQNDTVQTAKKNSALPIEGITTTQNKIRKFREEVAPLFENGKVWLLEDDPVQKKFVEELLSCPNGKYDDTIDAFHLATKDIPYLHKASDYAVVV
jgi:predicted phage terminase large subunit-like protein